MKKHLSYFVCIEAGKAKDAAKIVACHNLAIRKQSGYNAKQKKVWTWDNQYAATIERRITRNEIEVVLATNKNQKLEGFIFISKKSAIEALYVSNTKKGIGDLLIKTAIGSSEHLCVHSTKNAIQLYEKNGFIKKKTYLLKIENEFFEITFLKRVSR